MDFPNELWNRSPEWWESVLAERETGTDVGDWLREWDCYSPEQAAHELSLETEDVHRMLELGVLENRIGTDGDLQLRAQSVMEKELLNEGVDSAGLPPYNHDARPGRTGSGRYPKYGIPYLTSQFGD